MLSSEPVRQNDPNSMAIRSVSAASGSANSPSPSHDVLNEIGVSSISVPLAHNPPSVPTHLRSVSSPQSLSTAGPSTTINGTPIGQGMDHRTVTSLDA